MAGKAFLVLAVALTAAALSRVTSAAQAPSPETPAAPAVDVDALFQPASVCMTCHNGLVTPSGEDISFGTAWRASMMAHSALDPYWQAGVRREVMDHPKAQGAIENECSRCHMPMAHVRAQAVGQAQAVFANVPGAPDPDPLAVEGVSCAVCHQITGDRLGQKDSFTGHFTIDMTTPLESRRMFGPYAVDRGRTALMRSVTGFVPTTASHIQQSELCATCHTLYTRPLDKAGQPGGEFPEQVPYQEWLESEFRTSQSCQACHMPVVTEATRIASVVGEPREDVSRHTFLGANFFMLGMLNRYRADLGVVARSAELDAAVSATKAFLETSAARVEIARAQRVGSRLEADVVVRNLAGHKLPTAYPSRRAWLWLTVRDAQGRVVFSSGDVSATGAIKGNDNDQDAARFEPHYREIRTDDQVQIYESIIGNRAGAVTTGLLSAVSYLKDNRVPPRGFNKRAVPADVAVHGDALDDPDFTGGSDSVRYSIDVSAAQGPVVVDAQLWYQPIGHRWAQNLRAYYAPEPRRFVRYFDAMASSSALLLARAPSVPVP
jgi:hypothetical protein